MAWLCPHTTGAAAAASVLQYASTFCVGVARGGAAPGLSAPGGLSSSIAFDGRSSVRGRGQPLRGVNPSSPQRHRRDVLQEPVRQRHDAPLEGGPARLAGAAP